MPAFLVLIYSLTLLVGILIAYARTGWTPRRPGLVFGMWLLGVLMNLKNLNVIAQPSSIDDGNAWWMLCNVFEMPFFYWIS